MNKTDLIENYTLPQLVDMIINLQNASEVKTDEIQKMKWNIKDLEESNKRLKAKLDSYDNFLLPRCTKEAREMIDHNHFSEVRIVTWEQWNDRREKSVNISDIQKCQGEYEKILKENPLESTINKISRDILEQKNNTMAVEFTRVICDLLKQNGVYVHCTETKFDEKIAENSFEEEYGIVFDSMDFSERDKEFTDKIEALQTETEKYRKAFEGAKKERDHFEKVLQELNDKNKTELERAKSIIDQIDYILEKLFGVRHDTVDNPDEFEKILSERVKGNIINFLPTEPIKISEMLIMANGECEPLVLGNDVFKDTYRIFDVSELKQIAEHLFIYCNHHGEV